MSARKRSALAGLATLGALMSPSAFAADAAVDGALRQLRAELASANERLKALETEVARLSAETAATRRALSADQAQPMLLLVGEGPCPDGFKRVGTDLMLLTGPRTPKNSALIDAAGLADEEQQGVGARVYRYLDFCFRAAGAMADK